jgi:hypothetical protein
MMRSAAAEPIAEPADVGPSRDRPRKQIERTIQAVTAGAEASLHEAVHSVAWRRRGFLRRLSSWPRPSGTT